MTPTRSSRPSTSYEPSASIASTREPGRLGACRRAICRATLVVVPTVGSSHQPVTCSKPTRGSYVRGCRCPGCTEENRLYIHRYRLRGGTSVYREQPVPKGDTVLDSLCWCEEDIGTVSADDIAAGKTWSCGRAGCEPLFQAGLASR